MIIALSIGLAGCSASQGSAIAMHPPASPFSVLLIADGISVINTEKTVEDHVISLISGKNCSLVRASMGEDYCKDTSKPPTVQRVSYCYKTLAAINCYDHPIESDVSRLYGVRVDLVPATFP